MLSALLLHALDQQTIVCRAFVLELLVSLARMELDSAPRTVLCGALRTCALNVCFQYVIVRTAIRVRTLGELLRVANEMICDSVNQKLVEDGLVEDRAELMQLERDIAA